ncbi:MAG TPA: ATP-binding protein [Candidatus Paceibacterota bacterium]|nr:ATP-binding protein [Candidatus Paceibacterota bacterium]
MEHMMSGGTPTSIPLDFHKGNTVIRLSNFYASGPEFLREAAQNSLNKGAKNICAVIDHEKKQIMVYDDGQGAGFEEIKRKFSSISQSIDKGKPGSAAEKGIGVLSGIAIAERYQLFTRDRSTDEALFVYTLDQQELAKKDKIQLDVEKTRWTAINGAPFKATTMVKVTGVASIALRQLNDQDALERTLQPLQPLIKYHKSLLCIVHRSAKGKTEFTIKPARFRGVSLKPVVYETSSGPVTFKMWHCPDPVKEPVMEVLHKGVYQLPLGNFFHRRLLPVELRKLFDSGYFEGEISLDFCTVNPERSAFEQGAELQAFSDAVESFAREVLRPKLEQFKEEDRDDRLRKILRSVMDRVQDILTKNPNLLPEGFKVPVETKGPGSKPKPEEQPTAKVRVKRQPLDPDDLIEQKKQTRETMKPRKRRQTHLEWRNGLATSFVTPPEEEGRGWRSRISKQGLIEINSLHSDFSEFDQRSQKALAQYVTVLVFKEVTAMNEPEALREMFARAFDRTFMQMWRPSE